MLMRISYAREMKRAAILLLAFAWQMLPQSRTLKVEEYPSPMVRESQEVMVNGVVERWQLEWRGGPISYCGVADMPITCPCFGFAYGEAGMLDLVRYRGAGEIERLRLTTLFEDQFSGYGNTGISAIIQRWPFEPKDANLQTLAQLLQKRKTVQVMHFADYNHDGSTTEFLLQTDTAPCGKEMCVAIGVSKLNPRLHVFGTAIAPRRPLQLERGIWERFREATAPVETMAWGCWDHGSEVEEDVLLRATPQGIDGKWREYSCPPQPRRLLKESPLNRPLY